MSSLCLCGMLFCLSGCLLFVCFGRGHPVFLHFHRSPVLQQLENSWRTCYELDRHLLQKKFCPSGTLSMIWLRNGLFWILDLEGQYVIEFVWVNRSLVCPLIECFCLTTLDLSISCRISWLKGEQSETRTNWWIVFRVLPAVRTHRNGRSSSSNQMRPKSAAVQLTMVDRLLDFRKSGLQHQGRYKAHREACWLQRWTMTSGLYDRLCHLDVHLGRVNTEHFEFFWDLRRKIVILLQLRCDEIWCIRDVALCWRRRQETRNVSPFHLFTVAF